MQHRFVSARGPDQPPTGLDVRYLEATPPDFKLALATKARLDPGLQMSGYTTVIYRLSYDPLPDEFYWSRQIDLRPEGGNEKYAGEPSEIRALSYELFSVSVSVLTSGQEFGLAAQIHEILKRSNSSKPSNGHP